MTSRHASALAGSLPDPGSSSAASLTFISIHDLSPEARILYSSESVVDVLGYTPDEIVNRSIWEFFPEEELPNAKSFHKNGVAMDKAAMLVYCRVKDSSGQWVGCECCFTVVYDVIVVCTSVYKSGIPSQKRALEAPVIRRLFSSSPLDPRYHMLSHISQKFRQPAKSELHEPRAALFLNRFTRTLTIMYATSGIQDILGIPSSALKGKSFYFCIAENCLSDAVHCLENAKGNDSIAYMRFWYRDPREAGSHGVTSSDDSDEEMTNGSSLDQEMSGGVNLNEESSGGEDSSRSMAIQSESSMDVDESGDNRDQSRTSSGDSTHRPDTHEAIFGTLRPSESSSSSAPVSPDRQGQDSGHHIELEAVVSCASDGLVVCLRRARPLIPDATTRIPQSMYRNGLFAAPWADQPIIPSVSERPAFGLTTAFTPALGPQGARQHIKTNGTSKEDFMTAIREQAVFAWGLTGINGSVSSYASGIPRGESVPPDGAPIWQADNNPRTDSMQEPTDRVADASPNMSNDGKGASPGVRTGAAYGNDHRTLFGDPGVKRTQPNMGNGPTSPAETRSPTHVRSPTSTRSNH